VRLRLARARLDELLIDGQATLSKVEADGLQLETRAGAEHRVAGFGFEIGGIAVAGAARLGTAAPLPLAIQTRWRPGTALEGAGWSAALDAVGSAAELRLTGTLRGTPSGPAAAKRPAPALDLLATLHPLQPWVLAALSLKTQGLDLAALSPRAPTTALSGQADLQGGASGTPLTARIQLTNALPGRWNEGRLPLRRIALEASGEAAHPDRLTLRHFEVDLADALRPAGRWSGSAVWQGHELRLQTVLEAILPQRLDGRAAAMTLGGPVAATLIGLPSPDFRTGAATPSPPPRIEWTLDLQGLLERSPQPVQLRLEGSADDQRLELKRAHAQAGSASADLSARLARNGSDWQVQTAGSLQGFDPLRWWPGDASAAWRKGPHRLSGQWQLQLRLPGNADRLPPLALAQRLAGNGSLHIHDSVLAGVPLNADITLGYTQAAAPTPASLLAEIQIGGNELRIDGRGDPAGDGQADRWRAELKAEQLAALAPLTLLDPSLADWVPRRGSASATLAADGRWPALRTEGSARLAQLQVGGLTLARGSVGWRMDTRGEQPLALQLDLAGVQLGRQRADNLRAELRGTLAQHHIEIAGALPLVPPPLAEQVLGIQAQSGTRAQMSAEGAWLPDATGGGRWRAHIERLLVGSWDGSSATGPPASSWAEARDLHAELQFDAGGDLVGVQADPGGVSLADAAALRWDEVRIDLHGESAQIQLHADIEPFALAPLLARAQPGMGWQGDLRLAARIDIRAAERFDADLVFERRDGDLQLANGETVQRLGLSEFRIALAAHDGVWNLKPVFRGRSLGDISGELRVQTTPERRWPHPEAALSGSVQARAADIGIWSAWVPPGWRLVGELNTTASLGGSFGAPRYTGEVTGSGLGVRNLLQGVNVSDGQIALRLNGDTATVERFTLRGGDGSLRISGGATLGTAPRAQLQLEADHFRVLGRVDRQATVSGKAELILQAEQSRLEGTLKLDEGLYDATRRDAPSLDDDVTVRRPGTAADLPAEIGPPRARRNFALDLGIEIGDRLRIRGRGLDTSLRGRLRLGTPGGRLAVTGTISTEGGTYAAYGQKLDIERGIVAFNGAADNPRLDVLALRPNSDTRIGVLITGNLLTPRVRLYSEPDMSDTDKLSWLVLGRAPDGLGRNDTALLQRAAVALLSGEGEAPTDALLKNLGLDELSLKQSDTDVRETVVSLGKQLSRRWYVGYERGVNATTGTWQLIYRIAQRFTLRAQSGLENALDVIWTWRFQETPPEAGLRKATAVPP
jgi:translocation and assembly module TamB